MSIDIGHCEHGEFELRVGCPQCIADKMGEEGNTEESIAECVKEAEADSGEELVVVGQVEPGELVLVVDPQDLRPGEDMEMRGHFMEALKLLEYAEARVIATPADVKMVNDDLACISKLKKVMEGRRKLLLEPFDAIRDTYTYLMTPVLGAQKIYKEKMLAYNTEQERIRQVQEEINRKRMEAAKQEMELKGELSESVNLVEVAPEVPKTVRTALGSMTQTDHWTYEIVDIDLLPRWCMVPDAAQLTTIARSHHDKKEVPGVRFFNKPIMTSRPR